MNSIKPIFIFCMPRSGSTLLQRVLMSNVNISSSSEPHILLPLAHTLKREGVVAQYMHQNVVKATEDLIASLPHKHEDYFKLVREFVNSIYQLLSDPKATYFLDKTPNYHWIIPEIHDIFPNAKFIFLFRNPVQSLSSAIKTFGKGRFNRVEMFYLSAVDGFEELSKGYQLLKNKSYCLKYEDFIQNPEFHLKEISAYLNLEYDNRMIENFNSQKLNGRLGDPTGIKDYNSINKTSTEKWRLVFNTRFRKQFLKNYIKKHSEESLIIQGYDKNEICTDIESLNTNGKYNIITDVKDVIRLNLIGRFKINLFFGKNLKWIKNKYLN